MKYILSLFFLSLTMGSCSKENCIENLTEDAKRENLQVIEAKNSLIGSWKLIQIKNNFSGVISTNLTPGEGEAIVTFNNDQNSSFKGKTPRNTIWGDYSIGEGMKMVFDIETTTKVGENEWGRQFWLNSIEETTDFYFYGHNKLVLQGTVSTMTLVRL